MGLPGRLDVSQEEYNRHLWKRRVRIATSAPPSDKEILLFVCWKTGELPTQTMRKDRLLWPMFVLRTEWFYQVSVRHSGAVESEWFMEDEKEALATYRKLCKDFPRSKEVDYGLPLA